MGYIIAKDPYTHWLIERTRNGMAAAITFICLGWPQYPKSALLVNRYWGDSHSGPWTWAIYVLTIGLIKSESQSVHLMKRAHFISQANLRHRRSLYLLFTEQFRLNLLKNTSATRVRCASPISIRSTDTTSSTTRASSIKARPLTTTITSTKQRIQRTRRRRQRLQNKSYICYIPYLILSAFLSHLSVVYLTWARSSEVTAINKRTRY